MKRSRLPLQTMTASALCTALLVVCSWVTVPSPVPFTLQTFAVFCTLSLLGGAAGTLSIAIYLALGALGLPVFTGFRGGVGVLISSTGGYLFGFLFAGLLYLLLTKVFPQKPLVRLLSMIAGNLFCYVFGTLWFLLLYTGTERALGSVLGVCVLPFLIPDAAKLVLAYFLSERLRSILLRQSTAQKRG